MLSFLLAACSATLTGVITKNAPVFKSTKFPRPIALLVKGTKVTIKEQTSQWIKIDLRGHDAYVRAQFVKVAQSSNSVGDTIVSYAKSKLGCSYVYGAAGPNTFDCSGLTQWCHAQVGISIPRTASAQSQSGTKVTQANLLPGDVCCFYSPVSHVGIYVGSGNCIHAPHSGDVVKTTGIQYMSFQYGRRYW
ncbi:NlpC/P60 family protein [Histomonas meleagridis]|uniref:NlpC/P60 family protein n=1 Tax=Histomonas meleagridis TaxID=135588 RepID=UPI0035595607|nr:NlpC/P60 family protein [Histomonas meleagridis]KAH0796671.1 NlpC/P60 family protein [Histomonas meleagridis]